MEFRLDEVQVELQSTVRRFCATHFAIDRVADREHDLLDRRLWGELGELGVFSLLLDEPERGHAFGLMAATVVFEELGSHLVSGPLLWSILAAGMVDGADSGRRVVGGVDLADATSDATVAVEHASWIDALLLLDDDGVYTCNRAELSLGDTLDPLDPLTPLASFNSLPLMEKIGDAAEAAGIRLVGTVLAAALLLGLSARALEVARSYALEREQFDAPIGSFQAVKHMLADMYVRTVLARSATYAAAAVDGCGDSDRTRSVAAAKVLAAEAAIENARTCVQVLGGMGFTWEMPPNYLLKRAWVLENTFGSTEAHSLALGNGVGEIAQ